MTTCQCLVAGKFTDAQTDRYGEVWNPSTGDVIAKVPLCTPADVDRAVQAANRAFPAWRETPAPDRARIMFRYRELIARNADDIARTVSREHGKTFAEARASVQRGVEMVEFACGLPSLLVGEIIENLAPNVDSETVRHPLGVVAGITPFNFPAMVPLWMYPVALVCGNCFVLKPSERVPLSAMRLGELLLEAGIPPGVFNVVHGDKVCVDRLLEHPRIAAVSFVGSTPIARYIYETGTRHGKRVQALGGAKNHMIVLPDADIDMAADAAVSAAYGSAGERCMAVSMVVTVGDVADPLIAAIKERIPNVKVGDGMDPDSEMGPLVT